MNDNRLTIAQAAERLGIHPNTVRNRIKKGSLPAHMVMTVHGETYLIDPDDLGIIDIGTPSHETVTASDDSTPAPAGSPAQLVGQLMSGSLIGVIDNLVSPLVRELEHTRGDVARISEELGREKLLREQAEAKVAELEARLEQGDPAAYMQQGQDDEVPIDEWRPLWRRLLRL